MDGTTVTVQSAGWVATALLLGQLLTSLGLPLLGVSAIDRCLSMLVSAGLVIGLAVSGLGLPSGPLLGWFLVGACCGVLQFLGAVAAAHYSVPARAFAFRLGIILLLASGFIIFIQLAGVTETHTAYLLYLGCGFAFVLTVGNALYAPSGRLRREEEGDQVRLKPTMVAGLAAIFALFVGQTGLLAYVIIGAVDRGISLTQVAWVFAAVKATTGVWMILQARRSVGNVERPRFVVLGVLLAASGFAMSATLDVFVFFAVLTMFEICFNTLSARLQGAVASSGPGATGRWIAGTLLLGSACGPPLHGAAIGMGFDLPFVFLAMTSALLPAVWRLLIS